METGVYIIRNVTNNRGYIGSTVDFKTRWRDHRYHLRKGIHHARKLQNAWNKYGEEFFVFEVLLECSEDQLIFQEQLAISGHHSEYNSSSSAIPFGPGIPKTQEWKDQQSQRMAGNTIWIGRKHSQETKQLMSQSAIGRIGPRGSRNGRAKLTEEQVKQICFRRQNGEGVTQLAKEFSMHPGSITRITRGYSKW